MLTLAIFILAAATAVHGQCGGVLSVGANGATVIKSPNHPAAYSPYGKCTWTITAPAGQGLLFTATSFDVEGSGKVCSYDHLKINHVAFCGKNGPSNYYAASPATVVWTTDSSVQMTGFSISITAGSPPPPPAGCTGTHIDVVSGVTSYLLSPNFPLNYPDNADCTWTVSGPADKGLQVNAESFSTEANLDHLNIHEGVKELGKFSGATGPNKIRVASNSLTFRFRTDSSVTQKGFNISIIVDNCPGANMCPNDATVCISPSQYCNGIENECPANLDEQYCNGECGIAPIPPNLALTRHVQADKIVGGAVAVPHSWPWQIAFVQSSGFQFCGGTVIDRNWVLTAAHCCAGQSVTGTRVRVGAHNLNTPAAEPSSKLIGIKRIISHPQYSSRTTSWDFCLLELAEPVTFGIGVQPACLASVADNVDGTRCFITGWGNTGPRDTFGRDEFMRLVGLVESGRLAASQANFLRGTNVLMQVDVNLVSDATCSRQYGAGKIEPNMICAAAPGHDTCQGDSGGPLVCPRANGEPGFVLVGVTSWGRGCADPNYAGVYGRVSHALSWMTNTMYS